MRGLFIAIGIALFLMPVPAMAAEPVIEVDCLCAGAKSASGRSDAAPSQEVMDRYDRYHARMMSSDDESVDPVIVVLSAKNNKCSKYPERNPCGMQQEVTGRVRIKWTARSFMLTDEDFKWYFEGEKIGK